MIDNYADTGVSITDKINHEIDQSILEHKKGAQLIAEANGIKGKKVLEKDLLVLASVKGGSVPVKLTAETLSEAPKLPASYMSWGSKLQDSDQQSIVAIIGTVLALQAKSNSNFWSTLFKQSFSSMMAQVKMAPITAEAVKNQYNAQSQATQAQADQALWTGIINLGAFALTCGLGAYQEFSDGASDTDAAAQDLTNSPAEEAAEETEGLANDETENASNETKQANEDADEVANNETNKGQGTAKKLLNAIKDGVKKGGSRISQWLGRTIQVASMTSMLKEGIVSTVTKKYQDEQAFWQGQEGQAASLSKVSESYANYYGQNNQRQTQMWEGAQQNIDYAMNILKGVSDGITQSVVSMFRG